MDVLAQILDPVLLLRDEFLPAARAELGDAQQPLRIELAADMLLQEVLAATP
jgi:hypothetical protein